MDIYEKAHAVRTSGMTLNPLDDAALAAAALIGEGFIDSQIWNATEVVAGVQFNEHGVFEYLTATHWSD